MNGRGSRRTSEHGERFATFVGDHLRPALAARSLDSDSPIILVQSHDSPKYHIAASVLATALAMERDARIVVYRYPHVSPEIGNIGRFRRRLRSSDAARNERGTTSEWAQLVADDVVNLRIRRADLRRADGIVEAYRDSDPTVEALAQLEIHGVNVGEVLIDKIVQKGAVRIDPLAPKLMGMLREEAARLFALEQFLSKQPVAAMLAIDIAYAPGLSLRLALARGLDAFVAHHRQFLRLTPEKPFSTLQSADYPALLDALDDGLRASVRREGERFLASRLEPGAAGFTTTGSLAWEDGPSEFLDDLDRRERKVVLVATHSFYDAQHAGGPFLFSDFFSWLEHIKSIAKRTDRLWLIKLHPDSRDTAIGVGDAVAELFAEREDIVVLPAEVTQRQLLAYGINLVYTIYGTAAMEFPFLGVPAVTAKALSTHSPFGYALTPTDLVDLERLLLDEGTWDYGIDRDELCEYAALHYLALEPVLPQFLHRAQSDAGSGWPWDEDWNTLISPESFRSGLAAMQAWLASGAYSATHFFGLRMFLGELRRRADESGA